MLILIKKNTLQRTISNLNKPNTSGVATSRYKGNEFVIFKKVVTKLLPFKLLQ